MCCLVARGTSVDIGAVAPILVDGGTRWVSHPVKPYLQRCSGRRALGSQGTRARAEAQHRPQRWLLHGSNQSCGDHTQWAAIRRCGASHAKDYCAESGRAHGDKTSRQRHSTAATSGTESSDGEQDVGLPPNSRHVVMPADKIAHVEQWLSVTDTVQSGPNKSEADAH